MDFDLKKAFTFFAIALLIEGVFYILFYVFIYPYFVGMIGGLAFIITAFFLLLFVILGKLPREMKKYSPTLFLFNSVIYSVFSLIWAIAALDTLKYLFLAIGFFTLASFCTYIYIGLKRGITGAA
jgi:hypothetical protein